jgi:lipopolysaccharide export system permease protein
MVLTFFIVMFVLLMQIMWRYIDELVGKGLTFDVIAELMFYFVITLIPVGLPLATLLASIMTMGDLGENNELLALKSTGVSLPRIMRPLAILVLCISVGSFFVANNLVPLAYRKTAALLYDIRQQRHSIEFQDGIFFNGIDNMSIRVGHQDPETKRLTNLLIYDTRNRTGKMTTTTAESGFIGLSDDKEFLKVTLFDGETYEEDRGREWYDRSSLQHYLFDRQDMTIPLEGFNMARTDESMFSSAKTHNIKELAHDIDSLKHLVDNAVGRLNSEFLANSVFIHNKELAFDTLPKTHRRILPLSDSIAYLSENQMAQVVSNAVSLGNHAKSYLNYDEEIIKQNINQYYRLNTEWHKMLSLPVSIMIFFLIGAPLGAIIRKGGLGMPIVISVSFFVIYYIISITGEKMANEGVWNTWRGAWLSTMILTPIAFFLTYKATNDSALFNAEAYLNIFKKGRNIISGLVRRFKP